MEIKEISELENKSYWISKIKEADWRAAKFLVQLLESGNFYDHCGSTSKLFLLINNLDLISLGTYPEKDEIPETNLNPWIGFVYTFPQFRGKRRIGILIDHIYHLAKNEGFKNIYISTDQSGLYENFGFTFKEKLKDRWDGETLVYKRPIY